MAAVANARTREKEKKEMLIMMCSTELFANTVLVTEQLGSTRVPK
jgi:hypothetical protein